MPWTDPLNLQREAGPLWHWLTDDTYEKGDCDYSITELLSPVQLTVLRKHHAKTITQDPAHMLASRIGTAIHQSIHEAWKRSGARGVSEERFYFTLDGATIGFSPDFIDDQGVVHDWKSTKIWGVLDGAKPDWTEQLRAYDYGLASIGIDATALVDWAVILDHSPNKVEELPYPIVRFDIPRVPHEVTEAFLQDRLNRVREAEAALASGGLIPECTSDERWVKPGKWAVCKRGNKRALALRDTEEEARELLNSGWKKATHLERREGAQWFRCANYCAIGKNNLCPQFDKENA